MNDFFERLLKEQIELEEKVEKLTAFVESDNFSNLSGNAGYLLKVQLNHMNGYNDTLLERIKLIESLKE